MSAAIATGGFFIGATFHAWAVTAISGGLAFALILCWLWTTAERPVRNARDAGCGFVLPVYVSGPQSVGWWAMFITVLADGTAFVSVVFGYFFYWTGAPTWPPQPGGDVIVQDRVRELLAPALDVVTREDLVEARRLVTIEIADVITVSAEVEEHAVAGPCACHQPVVERLPERRHHDRHRDHQRHARDHRGQHGGDAPGRRAQVIEREARRHAPGSGQSGEHPMRDLRHRQNATDDDRRDRQIAE